MFSREVPWTFKMVEISQKLQEIKSRIIKIRQPLMAPPPPNTFRYRLSYNRLGVNIASIFATYLERGGCVAPWILPTQEKQPTPASHTLHNGAFMTILSEISKKKTKTKKQQVIGYEWTRECIICIRLKKKSPRGNPLPPRPMRKEKISRITEIGALKTIF